LVFVQSLYRDKKVVGVFVVRFRAPLQLMFFDPIWKRIVNYKK
jgi:hypothetical protein